MDENDLNQNRNPETLSDLKDDSPQEGAQGASQGAESKSG
jgi:hypothetical protein